MSLSGLHYLMFMVKCRAPSIGGLMNLRSLDWEKLIYESQMASMVFIVCVLCKLVK